MVKPTSGEKRESYIPSGTELTDFSKAEEKKTETPSKTGENRVSEASDSKFQTTTSKKQGNAKTTSFHGARALWENFVTSFHNFCSNIMKSLQKTPKKDELEVQLKDMQSKPEAKQSPKASDLQTKPESSQSPKESDIQSKPEQSPKEAWNDYFKTFDQPKPDNSEMPREGLPTPVREGLPTPVLDKEAQNLIDALHGRDQKTEEKPETISTEKKKPVELKPIAQPVRRQLSENDKKICEKRKEDLIDQLFPEDIKNLEKAIDSRITDLAANFEQPGFKVNETLDETIARFKELPSIVTYNKTEIQNQTIELLNIKKEIKNNASNSDVINHLLTSNAWNKNPVLRAEVKELEGGKGLEPIWDKIIDNNDIANGTTRSLSEDVYKKIIG